MPFECAQTCLNTSGIFGLILTRLFSMGYTLFFQFHRKHYLILGSRGIFIGFGKLTSGKSGCAVFKIKL